MKIVDGKNVYPAQFCNPFLINSCQYLRYCIYNIGSIFTAGAHTCSRSTGGWCGRKVRVRVRQFLRSVWGIQLWHPSSLVCPEVENTLGCEVLITNLFLCDPWTAWRPTAASWCYGSLQTPLAYVQAWETIHGAGIVKMMLEPFLACYSSTWPIYTWEILLISPFLLGSTFLLSHFAQGSGFSPFTSLVINPRPITLSNLHPHNCGGNERVANCDISQCA